MAVVVGRHDDAWQIVALVERRRRAMRTSMVGRIEEDEESGRLPPR